MSEPTYPTLVDAGQLIIRTKRRTTPYPNLQRLTAVEWEIYRGAVEAPGETKGNERFYLVPVELESEMVALGFKPRGKEYRYYEISDWEAERLTAQVARKVADTPPVEPGPPVFFAIARATEEAGQ